jgi:ABC-type cobalamin/Fe3+-siderophores transport system ATPase subunit
VSIEQYGNTCQYQELLEEALRRAGIKHGLVARKVASALSPAALAEIIKQKNVDALVKTAELNPEQARKVADTLAVSTLLFRLETVELADLPRIELKDGETYKDTMSLSTGQKCTTMLPILLLDTEAPLLVDQPEDNLDNRFVYETVVDSIRKVKPRRQLVFITHNPNIPVLGDAEKVIVLDSDGANGRKTNEGTVDECKDDIVTLLEGGEEAFKRRKDRYSY